MKLIKPSFEIIEQKPRDIVIPADMEIGPQMWKEELINSVYRQIEMAGRTCYKSEDKITETSAKEFVDRMVKSGHGAMLEHGTVYLAIPLEYHCEDDDKVVDNWYEYECYEENPYSETFVNYMNEFVYITTNYRVLVENNWLDDLQYICEPTEFHEKRVTVKFMCDRGVSHEFVRHRVFSFAQESTRYCNYSKDKFGKECTFIEPCWFKEDTYYATRKMYESTLTYAEKMYFSLLDMNWKPQQARAVLPNSLKTELIMTGTLTQWEGFFKLRDAGSAHPQAYELAHPLHEEFIKRGWIK